jgi:16S rRNA (guanine527-N7)-methyltransferase
VLDPEEIVKYHFAESFLATKAVDALSGRLADVGSGAGFPGLALKIYLPGLQVSLIEANSKKCVFLAEVIRSLRLEGVAVVHTRFEGIEDNFDIVSSRALGSIPKLLVWAQSVTLPSAHALLWLGPKGIREASASPRWTWNQPYAIPATTGRFILSGRPNHQIIYTRSTWNKFT